MLENHPNSSLDTYGVSFYGFYKNSVKIWWKLAQIQGVYCYIRSRGGSLKVTLEDYFAPISKIFGQKDYILPGKLHQVAS